MFVAESAAVGGGALGIEHVNQMAGDDRSTEAPRPRLGVSACLLGECVRFDGGHKLASVLVTALGLHVEWVPVCPEVETGMGTPRETIRLEGDRDAPRLIAPLSGTDWTARMQEWARGRLDEIAAAGLHGFVLKARSPSCGLRDAAVHPADGRPDEPRGRGLFAVALAHRFPRLPIEDEEGLAGAAACDAFLARVREFQFARLPEIQRRPPPPTTACEP